MEGGLSQIQSHLWSADKKSNLMNFSSNYCSMLVVPKYFLSYSETEFSVTFLTDKWISVVRTI